MSFRIYSGVVFISLTSNTISGKHVLKIASARKQGKHVTGQEIVSFGVLSTSYGA